MRKHRQGPLLAGLCIIASLLLPTPTASAAESIPELQYPAIPTGRQTMVSGPNGSLTLPCSNLDAGVNLVTYDSAGTLVRQLDRTSFVDGIQNCITNPVVDKNNVLYGITSGKTPSGSYANGQYLYAYTGNALKWKYPLRCGSNQLAKYAVGANGNIYATAQSSDGMHLIGIAPELETGQTQPAKVLDIKVADDCSTEVFPYRDGIMLRGQNSGFKYYSYSGKLLAQPQVNRFWDARLGASGELFDTTAGSFNSVNVTMYSPRTGQTAWTTVASTPGAATQSTSLYPIPGGGVAALIKEQKMVSDGIPATPTTYISTLAILNAAGQRVSAFEVPGEDGAGNIFTYHRIVPSDNGKLAIVSDVQQQTGLSYPTTISAISVRVFDVATGSWIFQRIMSGNLNKPGGPTGFYLAEGPVISDNTIFLIGQCSGNCAVYQEKKLYAVNAPVGLGLNYPRATLLSPRPASPYVALGDSFSSGEGVEPFEPGTSLPSGNECHRSTQAYPQLIAGSSPKIPAFGAGGFRACGGAKSKNIWEAGQWNEDIQLGSWLDATTQVVTLTVGGNDIAFGDFAKACVAELSSCGIGSQAHTNSANKIENELFETLTHAYRQILKHSPNAKVFVIGYPHVMADKAPDDPLDVRCAYMYDAFDGVDHWRDVRAARDIVTKLNAKIGAAITAVKNDSLDSDSRLRFVPTDGPTSSFHGHETCGPLGSWFLNVDQAAQNANYVFHPNASGQQGYAAMISAVINAS